MSGYSEKEVGIILGISRYTVHIYVMDLHRHFGVSSRGNFSPGVWQCLQNRGASIACPFQVAGRLVRGLSHPPRDPSACFTCIAAGVDAAPVCLMFVI
jgi:hypothetical protein